MVGGFNYDLTYNIVTLTFDPLVLSADRYRLDVQPTEIIGLGGNLDGNWSESIPGTMQPVLYDQGTLYDWHDDLPHPFPSGSATALGGSLFQFRFALAPGDYDQNGVVDEGDYNVWRIKDPRADGDGDGVVGGPGDYDVWRAGFDSYLWFQKYQADYNGDGKVDVLDYADWRAHFDEHVTLANPVIAEDGDSNGVVGMEDYVLWRDWKGSWSAWNLSAHGLGVGALLIDFTSAPEVVNVTISGSASTHTPYSFASNVGSGVQLQTVPVGGADTIAITFSEQVNVEAVNLSLVGLTTGNVPVLTDFSYDAVTFTATWRFTGLLANDFYAISLSDAITDTEGYRLDGEWTNPVSTTTTNLSVSHFPSGDGHAGGNFVFVFTLMSGDANFDNIVDDTDVNIWCLYYGFSDATFAEADFNGNGYVDVGTDLGFDVRELREKPPGCVFTGRSEWRFPGQ